MRSRIVNLAFKEYRHIMRDKRSLVIVFLIPIAMILLYGYAINLDVKNMPVRIPRRTRDHPPQLQNTQASAGVRIAWNPNSPHLQ